MSAGCRNFCNLYSSPSSVRMIKLRRMKWVAYVACMVEIRNPEWKRFLGRTKHGLEDSFKIVLIEIRQEGVEQIL